MDFKLKEFLVELSALTIKYHIEIGGCGCCGSPFLIYYNNCKNDGNIGEDLDWDIDLQQYTCEENDANLF